MLLALLRQLSQRLLPAVAAAHHHPTTTPPWRLRARACFAVPGGRGTIAVLAAGLVAVNRALAESWRGERHRNRKRQGRARSQRDKGDRATGGCSRRRHSAEQQLVTQQQLQRQGSDATAGGRWSSCRRVGSRRVRIPRTHHTLHSLGGSSGMVHQQLQRGRRPCRCGTIDAMNWALMLGATCSGCCHPWPVTEQGAGSGVWAGRHGRPRRHGRKDQLTIVS